MVAGKKELSKNLCFTFIVGISLAMRNYLEFLQELSYKDTMEIGTYRFCKINLIFSTYVCFAMILTPIPDRVS